MAARSRSVPKICFESAKNIDYPDKDDAVEYPTLKETIKYMVADNVQKSKSEKNFNDERTDTSGTHDKTKDNVEAGDSPYC